MAIDTAQSVTLDQSFFGEKAVNVGKSGSGKSYGARVMIEEARGLNVPVVIIDPQDAHGNLEALGFDYVHAKGVKDAEKYGRVVAATAQCVVIRTKGLGIEEQQRFVRGFLKGYRKSLRKGIQYLVIDEAHKFAPEHSNPESKDEVRALFQENRSDGVGALAISQRPARLDKTVLSQADHLMLFRVTSSADKQALRGYLDVADDVERLKTLPRGSAMLIGFGRDDVEPVAVRKAATTHTGNSPEHIRGTDAKTYAQHRRKLVKGESMSDAVSQNDAVKNVLPGVEGLGDLAMIGMKVGLGLAVSRIAAGTVGAMIERSMPGLPLVSGRTIAGLGTTATMYAGYRLLEKRSPMASEVFKYSAAGAAVFTVGSLFWDAAALTNVTLPAPVAAVVQVATGAGPVMAASESAPDINTYQQ